MKSGWKEIGPNGKVRDIPVGWEKGWIVENVYGWTWYGPPHSLWVDLCVLQYEPNEAQRAKIERHFADAKEPPAPFAIAMKLGKEIADREESLMRSILAESPQ